MRLVLLVGGAEIDVDVSAPPAATVADLADALAGGPIAPDTGLVVDGCFYGHWVAQVRRTRQGIALRPHLDLDGELWHTTLPRRGPDQFGPGRGYLVCEGTVELLQTAMADVPLPPALAPGRVVAPERRAPRGAPGAWR